MMRDTSRTRLEPRRARRFRGGRGGEIARLPPSLLSSFGGLALSPAEALAKASRRAERAPTIPLRPLCCLCDLCAKPCDGDRNHRWGKVADSTGRPDREGAG